MIQGFKAFILRGNVIELAVAVVIGAAFGAVVTSFNEALLTPLIAAIFDQPDFSHMGMFTINSAVFAPGMVLRELLNFALIAATIYFLVVVPMNRVARRRRREESAPAPAGPTEVELLTQIRDQLARQGDK